MAKNRRTIPRELDVLDQLAGLPERVDRLVENQGGDFTAATEQRERIERALGDNAARTRMDLEALLLTSQDVEDRDTAATESHITQIRALTEVVKSLPILRQIRLTAFVCLGILLLILSIVLL